MFGDPVFPVVVDIFQQALFKCLKVFICPFGGGVADDFLCKLEGQLSLFEAHYLFDISYSKIQAVIHPQSIIHSMVEFVDGSTIAQASPPNMKGPIGFALGYPDREIGRAHV